MGVDGFLERLTQDVLAALGVGDQPVHGQNQVVGHQAVGGREEAQRAHDDAALVLGQPVRVFPESDIGGHVHFLGHPVVRAAVEVLLPRPVIFERHQLVEVSASVDHHLVANMHAGRCAFQVIKAFLNVQVIQRFFGTGHGLAVGARYHACSCNGYFRFSRRGAGLGCWCSFGNRGRGGFDFFVNVVPAEHGAYLGVLYWACSGCALAMWL